MYLKYQICIVCIFTGISGITHSTERHILRLTTLLGVHTIGRRLLMHFEQGDDVTFVAVRMPGIYWGRLTWVLATTEQPSQHSGELIRLIPPMWILGQQSYKLSRYLRTYSKANMDSLQCHQVPSMQAETQHEGFARQGWASAELMIGLF